MVTNKVNFTKPALDALPTPSQGKRAYHYDTKTRGLAVCVTSNGNKTFYVVRWVAGKSERIRIGPFPDIPVEIARKKAEEINGQIAIGEDPQERKRQLKQDCTFAELFAWYLENHAKARKRTWAEDEEKFRNHCGPLAKRKVSGITRTDIRAFHAQIGKTAGPYAANRTLALVRCVFNKGVRHEVIRIDANPATGIDRFPEQSRDRRLMASELPTFLQALDEEANPDVRDFFLMLLCTGARRTNVQMMRWEEIDMTARIWRIPHTKNGLPQTLPLGEEEFEILERRKKQAHGPWVFPGRGPAGHLGEPKDAWVRICNRAGISGLRMHDLRRTLGSWMADTGASLPIIGKTLNHLSPQATAIYSRLSLDPIRDAKGKAVKAMLAAGRKADMEGEGPV